MRHLRTGLMAFLFALLPLTALAATATAQPNLGLVSHPGSLFCLIVFFASYVAVLLEEKTHLRKSKPVMLGAGIIWLTIGIMVRDMGLDKDALHDAVYHGLEEYGSLLLFLLAAMTFISALQDRRVFDALRSRLVRAGFTLRQLFWITGICAFFLSPIADNMTTALVMGAVVMAVGGTNRAFIALACINVVSAANSGGAFSPFGDITTLMVWQAGKLPFFDFFALFLPSVVNFLIPAIIMSFFVPNDKPEGGHFELVTIKRGGKFIIFLGLCTIATAISFEQFLGLPPFLGMMTGLSVLMITAYFIRKLGNHRDDKFDIIDLVAASEWDTLLFFFGVLFSVGGLTYIGYMEFASTGLYDGLGATITNIMMGLGSAVFDNIPLMYAVLSMNPVMDDFQWLLITLTTGVGGTLLSIGSAAGVALMGVARGHYTFFSHLKWTPVLLLGYGASIWVHFLVNG
ncbi:MAG: sodium:proton antiporter NhaD [Alphaproteobacteria bacterium]|nr:sodium:proton antiporter NhaD [Alphaproteobacteria bacterium]